jgi:Ca-activated chloride channel family protein
MSFFFAQPYFLAFLIPLFVVTFWYFRQKKEQQITLHLPHTEYMSHLASAKKKWSKWSDGLLFLALALGIIALARPQAPLREEMIQKEGIDIVLAIDLSLSMLATDFKPNRLEVAKDVAASFVGQRPYDRIGLVSFSGEAFTQCPITSDHEILLKALKELKSGTLLDGTAIGMGLATAVNRIQNSAAKSKVIILLTDGVNNAGYLQPLQAAELAKTFGIKVYTIGIGSNGLAMMPIARNDDGEPLFDMAPVTIDESTLIQIADLSNGGRYFRAHDKKELTKIYGEINQLEKTLIDSKAIKRKVELFFPLLLIAIIALVLHFTLRLTIFKTLP